MSGEQQLSVWMEGVLVLNSKAALKRTHSGR
jgi:hypothetical protein